MTYARSRLWLGISGVGLLVLLALAALWFDLPHQLLSHKSPLSAVGWTLATFVLVSIPSDILGGYTLPRVHGRSQQTAAAFASAWLQGVVAQVSVQGICAMALLLAVSLGGQWAGIACFAALLILLLVCQSIIARIVGAMTPSESTVLPFSISRSKLKRRPLILETSDPGFVGGFAGLPGVERLILPSAWLRNLEPENLDVELLRRRSVLATGSRTRGVGVAFLFNLIGFALASRMPGSSLANAAGLVQTALWFTLWSFAGLLTLPSLNRPAVFEADRFALEQGTSQVALSSAISSLDALQDDEPARSPWVERIFHPIPSVDRRVAALATNEAPRGAWQCARMALYLSWGCFGFLARAVHCNAGRPQLWVLFPGD